MKTTSVAFLVTALLALASCASETHREPAAAPSETEGWARASEIEGAVSLNWLAEIPRSDITELVQEALTSNFELRRQHALLEDSRNSTVIAGADRWPSFSASLDANRRGSDSPGLGSETTGTNYGLDGNIQWELDIWGELSASARAARLSYEADLVSFEGARRELVANTITLTFDAIAARQLLDLYERRLTSLESTFDIVNGSYMRGLTNALDVYLAQNSLEQQREVVAQQGQTVLESTATLQLLLGRYPDGDMALPESTPLVQTSIPVGLPSELLTRRQDIVAAWLALMAADARVAVAHRNRFPRLMLTASGGYAATSLEGITDFDTSNWSVIGSLTQPIFQAGRLRAVQSQAEARADALELQYLTQVQRAFAEVENSISRSASLTERYEALVKAESNARTAEQLSLEQYQRGLVSFTTVLESQRRAFDTGSSLVRVRNQLVQNRVAMYLALGGEFTIVEQ